MWHVTYQNCHENALRLQEIVANLKKKTFLGVVPQTPQLEGISPPHLFTPKFPKKIAFERCYKYFLRIPLFDFSPIPPPPPIPPLLGKGGRGRGGGVTAQCTDISWTIFSTSRKDFMYGCPGFLSPQVGRPVIEEIVGVSNIKYQGWATCRGFKMCDRMFGKSMCRMFFFNYTKSVLVIPGSISKL